MSDDADAATFVDLLLAVSKKYSGGGYNNVEVLEVVALVVTAI